MTRTATGSNRSLRITGAGSPRRRYSSGRSRTGRTTIDGTARNCATTTTVTGLGRAADVPEPGWTVTREGRWRSTIWGCNGTTGRASGGHCKGSGRSLGGNGAPTSYATAEGSPSTRTGPTAGSTEYTTRRWSGTRTAARWVWTSPTCRANPTDTSRGRARSTGGRRGSAAITRVIRRRQNRIGISCVVTTGASGRTTCTRYRVRYRRRCGSGCRG